MENITDLVLNTNVVTEGMDIILRDDIDESEVRSRVGLTTITDENDTKMDFTELDKSSDNSELIINTPLLNDKEIDLNGKNLSEINSRLGECGLNNESDSTTEIIHQPAAESEEIIPNEDSTPLPTFTEPTVGEGSITENENYAETGERRETGFCYDWEEAPILLCSAVEEYKPTTSCENFTKGCQWSPDGTCLLVPSEDFRIRVYELPRELYSGILSSEIDLPRLKAALSIKEGGIVYDSCWFPMMSSWDPSTCCFASTSRESPVHLWDAFTGELRATYRAYNQVDEVEAAISVQFVNSGAEVWCGFKGALRTFDTGRPGRQVNTIYLKKDIPNVTGIVSCIRENPAMPGLVAYGTYSKTIGLYKDGPLCALKTASGVTQIEFSPCGMKLYSAVRRNNEMLCWDLRNPGVVLYSMQGREADTNQRIQFSVSSNGNEIVSGGTDGVVPIWQQDQNIECEEILKTRQRIKLSTDCINGVSLHRSLPIIATSSGQRICEEEDEDQLRDNSVRFWWCGSKR